MFLAGLLPIVEDKIVDFFESGKTGQISVHVVQHGADILDRFEAEICAYFPIHSRVFSIWDDISAMAQCDEAQDGSRTSRVQSLQRQNIFAFFLTLKNG